MNRWWILGAGLLASAGLVLTDTGVSPPSAAVSAPVELGATSSRSSPQHAPTRQSSKAMSVAPIRPLLDRQDLFGPGLAPRTAANLFAARSWDEPKAPVPSAGPAAETPPPFPYTVVGRKKEGQVLEVFLSRDDQNFVAREGQMLESDYLITKIGPTSMTVVYQRLNHAHEIPLEDMD